MKILLIAFSLIMMSCIQKSAVTFHELTGEYKSKKFGFVEWQFISLGNSCSRLTGATLSLNSDSTFKLITCGNIIDGIWTFDSDSIYLQVKKNIWRIDSLQENGFNGEWPQIPDKPFSYKIQDDELRAEYLSERKGKKHKTFNYLKKTYPNNSSRCTTPSEEE